MNSTPQPQWAMNDRLALQTSLLEQFKQFQCYIKHDWVDIQLAYRWRLEEAWRAAKPTTCHKLPTLYHIWFCLMQRCNVVMHWPRVPTSAHTLHIWLTYPHKHKLGVPMFYSLAYQCARGHGKWDRTVKCTHHFTRKNRVCSKNHSLVGCFNKRRKSDVKQRFVFYFRDSFFHVFVYLYGPFSQIFGGKDFHYLNKSRGWACALRGMFFFVRWAFNPLFFSRRDAERNIYNSL